jgi:hypothetical protein
MRQRERGDDERDRKHGEGQGSTTLPSSSSPIVSGSPSNAIPPLKGKQATPVLTSFSMSTGPSKTVGQASHTGGGGGGLLGMSYTGEDDPSLVHLYQLKKSMGPLVQIQYSASELAAEAEAAGMVANSAKAAAAEAEAMAAAGGKKTAPSAVHSTAGTAGAAGGGGGGDIATAIAAAKAAAAAAAVPKGGGTTASHSGARAVGAAAAKAKAGIAAATVKAEQDRAATIISSIPTDTQALFTVPIDWDDVEQANILKDRLAPFLEKKVSEYLTGGDTKSALPSDDAKEMAEEIVGEVSKRPADASSLVTYLHEETGVMETASEAEGFVVKLWRMLLYEVKSYQLMRHELGKGPNPLETEKGQPVEEKKRREEEKGPVEEDID